MLDNRHSVVFFCWIRSSDLRAIMLAIAATEAREKAGWDWDALKRAWLRWRRFIREVTA